MKAMKLVLPLAVLTMMGTAYAGLDSEDSTSPSFEDMDQNGDGGITREEARATPGLESNFDRLDANADGVLTREEIGMGGPESSEEEPSN